MRLKVRAAMRTDVGVVRDSNEDVAFVDPLGRYAILADGMGGPGAGEIAAATTVDVVRTCLDTYGEVIDGFIAAPSADGRDRIRALTERAVHLAHDVVIERQRKEPEKHGMGTTLEVVVVAGSEAFVTHVGDSRTYLVRDGVATQVTADHTVAEAMKRSGVISDSAAKISPLRTVLSSAVGMQAAVAVDHAVLHVRPGDRLLICSDGLHDYFDADELASRLSIADLDAALSGMITDARQRGGHDNITGILLEPVDPGAPIAGVPDDALDSLVDRTLREASAPVERIPNRDSSGRHRR